MRRLVSLAGRAWRAAEDVRAAARDSGAGVLVTGARAARLRRRGGFAVHEASALGLLDRPLTDAPVLASKRRALAAQARVNPPALAEMTENKEVFAAHCAAHRLPVPLPLGTIADGSAWPNAGLRREGRDAAGAWLLDPGLPDEFVIKPLRGYWGVGVRLISREGRLLRVRGADHPLPPGQLLDELAGDGSRGGHVVQELLRNHPDLVDLLGAAALHTTRMITFAAPGECRVLARYLRASVSSSGIDNFRDGRTGTIVCPIDSDGVIVAAHRRAATGRGLEDAPLHPVTGRRLVGEVVPAWEEAEALVRRAAAAFLPVRAIGWDVGITPGGPVLVEANCRWDPPPLAEVVRAVETLERA